MGKIQINEEEGQVKRVARVLAVVIGLALPSVTDATTLTTTHYRLDPNVAGVFGGSGGSTHYGLVDVGGEAAIGFGNSPSYKLGSGYIRELEQSIQRRPAQWAHQELSKKPLLRGVLL